MAAERSRRPNAGKNIGNLVDQESEVDDFYKTAYGGFEEGSEDEEYEVTDQSLYKAHHNYTLVVHC